MCVWMCVLVFLPSDHRDEERCFDITSLYTVSGLSVDGCVWCVQGVWPSSSSVRGPRRASDAGGGGGLVIVWSYSFIRSEGRRVG